MPQEQNLSSSAFESLPENIKDWLSSPQATNLIISTNRKLGLQGQKITVIPTLIFRLVTNDLEPLNFIDELAKELGVTFEVAKTVTKDIENKVLRPIERDLEKDLGLDVKVIYFGKPGGKPPQEAPAQEEKSTPKDSEIYIPKEPTATLAQESRKPPKVDLKTFEEISPFMLHQEKSEAGQRIPSETGPRINIKTSVSQAPTKEESKPISVKLESPRGDAPPAVRPAPNEERRLASPKISIPPTEPPPTIQNQSSADDNKTRVVHYHQFKTPVNNLGLPKQGQNENGVDLRKQT